MSRTRSPGRVKGIPEGFHFELLTSDFDHYEQFMENAIARVPALETAGVKQLINGPESFTPDGNFILGEAPELRNFFVGAGFNAFGIASGGGAGMALAEWVAKGEAPYRSLAGRYPPLRRGAPRRPTGSAPARWRPMASTTPSPGRPRNMHSARPTRRSPLYAHLKAAGACFGEKLGWERPNWFADLAAGEEPVDAIPTSAPAGGMPCAREHQAAREAAVLIDQTSFAKFTLKGPDAAHGAELDRRRATWTGRWAA